MKPRYFTDNNLNHVSRVMLRSQFTGFSDRQSPFTVNKTMQSQFTVNCLFTDHEQLKMSITNHKELKMPITCHENKYIYPTYKEMTAKLADMHVIVATDKVSNNVVFVCQKILYQMFN